MLDEIKQSPTRNKYTEHISETDETVPDWWRMGLDQKAQQFSMLLQCCPINMADPK